MSQHFLSRIGGPNKTKTEGSPTANLPPIPNKYIHVKTLRIFGNGRDKETETGREIGPKPDRNGQTKQTEETVAASALSKTQDFLQGEF